MLPYLKMFPELLGVFSNRIQEHSKLSLLLFFILLANCSLFAQTKYNIVYTKPTRTVINAEYDFGKVHCYDVDFIDSNHHNIKSIRQELEENHHAKSGYDLVKKIKYIFYNDSLISSIIFVNVIKRYYHKKDFTYNERGLLTGWVNYYYKPKISKDSFNASIDKDIFLNFPDQFPKTNVQVESKMEKKYEGDKLVYKCLYEMLQEGGAALPSREDSFKYNKIGQLVEHISNPKSDAGGSAYLRQTFEYDSKGVLTRKEWYEDGKHQGTDDYSYNDSVIVVSAKFYDIYGNGDPSKYSTMVTIYKKQADGNYYDEEFHRKFDFHDNGE